MALSAYLHITCTFPPSYAGWWWVSKLLTQNELKYFNINNHSLNGWRETKNTSLSISSIVSPLRIQNYRRPYITIHPGWLIVILLLWTLSLELLLSWTSCPSGPCLFKLLTSNSEALKPLLFLLLSELLESLRTPVAEWSSSLLPFLSNEALGSNPIFCL